MQFVQGYPNQDGNIQFYVEYPGSGTIMPQAILLLIITEQQASIQANTGLQFTIETTKPTIAPPPTPSPENMDNAITVVLTNYQADEVCCFIYLLNTRSELGRLHQYHEIF